LFSLSCSGDPRYLHSFPTRRSSDLLYRDTGAFTYDPGFTSTASCESKITYIDGDEGVLLHRGYPIEQLAEHGDFLEVCYLLLYRSEEHTSELQSRENLVCRLLLEKK